MAVSGTFEKMIGLINRYQTISKIPLLISIDGEYGLAMRVEKNTAISLCHHTGRFKERC
ncbi:hypothetical protein [Algoriphagus boritolerans]|uniref:hypothetical protein n=1 Tax=Algoriphagus boritolerans TaxID=308111 RepID=UPI002FCDE71D